MAVWLERVSEQIDVPTKVVVMQAVFVCKTVGYRAERGVLEKVFIAKAVR